MITNRSMWLGLSIIEAERVTREIRAASQEEPADIAVIREELFCNGRPVSAQKYRALFDYVIERGR